MGIFKETVIGVLITREDNVGGKPFFWKHPIVMDWDNALGSEVELEPKDHVIAFLPTPGSYKVYWESKTGKFHELGFEWAGATQPDWEKLGLEEEAKE